MNYKSEDKIIPRNIPTQEELKKLLHYDPVSGLFRWRVHRKNNVHEGDMAGTLRKSTKLLYITINRVNYKADRLAWLYMTGEYPEYEIKHKDGVRFINNWENLEIETTPEIKNYSKKKNKIRGVTQDRYYKVVIYHDGKRCYLGNYSDFDEAVCIRYAGEQVYFGDIKSPASEYVQTKIQKRG